MIRLPPESENAAMVGPIAISCGAIIALSPRSTNEESGLQLLGPGKYDPRFNLDGVNGPQVIRLPMA